MKPLRPHLIALLVALAVVLVSCGGGDDDADGGEAVTDFQVQMDSFFFDPENVTVVAGTDVTVTALNLDSALQHNWVIIEQGSEVGDEQEIDESAFLFQTAEIDPQTSATGTFNVAPGEYQVICTVPGHFSAGMVGTLTAVSSG